MLLIAYFIEQDSDKYLPWSKQFERELEKLKANEDIGARARQRLLAYSEAGGLKAIR